MTASSKPTPGPWKCSWENAAQDWAIVTDPLGGIIANVNTATGPNAHSAPAMRQMPADANARLIAEAINVHHETGLTPQQLREALADVARTALDFIEPWMKDRKYPETPEEWCALHDTDEPDSIYATRDRARAAIAKVEGRSCG